MPKILDQTMSEMPQTPSQWNECIREMPQPGLMSWWLPLVVMLFTNNVLASIDVISLEHRTPQEMAALLAPLLDKQERAVPSSAGLIIKAPQQRMTAIRSLIRKLDRRPKRLRITVLQTNRVMLSDGGAVAEDQAAIGPSLSGQIGVGGHLYDSRAASRQGITQEVQVIEGRSAFIAAGQERPQPVIGVYGFPPAVIGGIDYRSMTTGFAVLPVVLGHCRVQIQVTPWSDRLDADGAIETQSSATTLTATLGQWVKIGATVQEQGQSQNRLLGHRYRTHQQGGQLLVKVESLDGC